MTFMMLKALMGRQTMEISRVRVPTHPGGEEQRHPKGHSGAAKLPPIERETAAVTGEIEMAQLRILWKEAAVRLSRHMPIADDLDRMIYSPKGRQRGASIMKQEQRDKAACYLLYPVVVAAWTELGRICTRQVPELGPGISLQPAMIIGSEVRLGAIGKNKKGKSAAISLEQLALAALMNGGSYDTEMGNLLMYAAIPIKGLTDGYEADMIGDEAEGTAEDDSENEDDEENSETTGESAESTSTTGSRRDNNYYMTMASYAWYALCCCTNGPDEEVPFAAVTERLRAQIEMHDRINKWLKGQEGSLKPSDERHLALAREEAQVQNEWWKDAHRSITGEEDENTSQDGIGAVWQAATSQRQNRMRQAIATSMASLSDRKRK